MLQPFVDELPPGLEVIRFDVPGIGGSPLPVVPYHMTTLAPLVGQLVRQLGYERVDVLGFSWGGGLAQQFAVSRAEQCRRLVLAATGTGLIMVPGQPHVLARMLTPRRHRDPDYARADRRRALRRHHAQPPRAGRRGAARRGPGAARERGYYYQLLAGFGWSSLPVLGLIRQPTLIVAGDDDPIIPTINAKIMQRGIPRRPAAHLPRRPPGAAHRGRRAGPGDRRLPPRGVASLRAHDQYSSEQPRSARSGRGALLVVPEPGHGQPVGEVPGAAHRAPARPARPRRRRTPAGSPPRR